MSPALKAILHQHGPDAEYDYLLSSALLIQRHREAASSRHSFRAGINCSLIFSNDMGEPSLFPIVLLCLGADAGRLGSRFFIYLPRYRDGCRPGSWDPLQAPPRCSAEHLLRRSCAAPSLYRAIFFPGPLSPESLMRMRSPGVPCSVTGWAPKTAFPSQKLDQFMLTWRETGHQYFTMNAVCKEGSGSGRCHKSGKNNSEKRCSLTDLQRHVHF